MNLTHGGTMIVLVAALAALLSACAPTSVANQPGSPTPSAHTSTGATAARVSGVCTGVAHCHVVGRSDVDGDGTPDQIGWVRHKAHQIVVIRVKTAAGPVLQRRLSVKLWLGTGAWGGAAPIDGSRGAEILVGTEMGAHTPVYTMLTYRHQALVVERSPLGDSTWWVDAAYNYDFAWARHTRSNGVVTMTQKSAFRTSLHGHRFAGTDITWAWRSGHWAKRATVKRSYPTATAAAMMAGWRVPGLDRFPGVPPIDAPQGAR
ncbi:MAG: hypothetical protein ACRDPG_05705 [Nocardioidaceae bacterium]